MTQISPQPRVNLSRLRDIGWEFWDPIGLLGSDRFHPGLWSKGENKSFAGEYDSYLISAASQLRRGVTREQVVDYLVQIETDYIGLGADPTTRNRAEAVVTAILEDTSIWTWPDEKGRFS